MIETLDRIRERGRERDYLLDVLALWEVAKKAGYNPSDVKAFSFRPEFLSYSERRENQIQRARNQRDKYVQVDWHNCVRLNNGELKQIPRTKRPKPCLKK